MKTFCSPSLAQALVAPACNGISAFIDAALVSPNRRAYSVVSSSHAWLAVFEGVFVRFEDAKSKPLKLVLTSLMNILAKHNDVNERCLIQAQFLNAVLTSIVLREERSRIKASLVCLENFVRKNIVTLSDLMAATGTWLALNIDRFVAMYSDECRALCLPLLDHNASKCGDRVSGISTEVVSQALLLGLLKLAQDDEFASASGAVLAVFMHQTMVAVQDATLDAGQQLALKNQLSSSKLWAGPVKHIALQNVESLDSIANYVFHPVFTADPVGFIEFINELPLRGVLSGEIADAPLAECIVLFAALRVGKRIGLVHEDRTFPLTRRKLTPNAGKSELTIFRRLFL